MPAVVKDKVDILLVPEIQRHNSFPMIQFMITFFSKFFILDKNQFGGRLLNYAQNNPTKILNEYTSEKTVQIKLLTIYTARDKELISVPQNMLSLSLSVILT